MKSQKAIKEIVGDEIFNKLEKIAEEEVSLSLKIDLENNDHQDNYYSQRNITNKLFKENELFQNLGLTMMPEDVINVLFRCKLIFSVDSQQEYQQRIGGGSYHDEYRFIIPRDKKSIKADILIDEYLEKLETLNSEKVLTTQISDFCGMAPFNYQDFFDSIFSKLNPGFNSSLNLDIFKNNSSIIELDNNKTESAYIGYSVKGSTRYSYVYGSIQLKVLIDLLKIAGFINPGQINFGRNSVEIKGPILPVFQNSGSQGGYCRNEDKKEPWEKVPDGHLRNSYGYRHIGKMRIDIRNDKKISDFIIQNKIIFEYLENPRKELCIKQIIPTIDILSNTCQVTDIGSKFLLIYTCLEHLLLPQKIGKHEDAKNYIKGGINALNYNYMARFDTLYKLRCSYAHKGYIQNKENTIALLIESIKTIMSLLHIKLTNQKIISL